MNEDPDRERGGDAVPPGAAEGDDRDDAAAAAASRGEPEAEPEAESDCAFPAGDPTTDL